MLEKKSVLLQIGQNYLVANSLHFYIVVSSVMTPCSLVGRYQRFMKTVTVVYKSALRIVSRHTDYLKQMTDASRHADMSIAAAGVCRITHFSRAAASCVAKSLTIHCKLTR